MNTSQHPVASTPRATVRLQLHADFDFNAAAATVPYYAALGISHFYVSPIQTSRRGSTHGYDGTAPGSVDSERGGREGLRRLIARLREHDMGLIIDIAPNHLSTSLENSWWFDVLEHGRASAYANFFAIDWDDPELGGRVLAPFLADPAPEMLARRAIALRWDDGGCRFLIDVEGTGYPFSSAAYGALLRDVLPAAAALFSRSDSVAAFEAARRDLQAILREPDSATSMTAKLDAINARPDALAEWLALQAYELCDWRDAARRINWRRFFDLSELIALRSEDDAVFAAFHRLPFELYAAGEIDGLRIDHIDGLTDPATYCARLRASLDELESKRPATAPAGGWVVVEKILGENELLRRDWRIDGSTGYDFMDQVGGLLHDARSRPALDQAWTDIGGKPYEVIALTARREVLERGFQPDFSRAARAARLACPTIDGALLDDALKKLLHHYPRYRGYSRVGSEDAQENTALATACAGARDDGADAEALDALSALYRGISGAADTRCAADAIAKFQQLCAPLAARAIEDTALYRYGRLLSRNEVGSDPSTLSFSSAHFHECTRTRAQNWPRALLTTATHDHKRGEDARMRIASIGDHVERWRALTGVWRSRHAARRGPDTIDRHMFYQTLLSIWPDGDCLQCPDSLRERLAAWQLKSIRERKRHGDWANPDHDYEDVATGFIDALLDDAEFIVQLAAFLRLIERPAAIRGLVQTTLRCTAPGIPDLYQGNELWDFSLVDPDNRSPVDYDLRAKALADAVDDADVLADWRDGRVKQRLIQRLLALRSRYPDVFAGGYRALELTGPHADAFIAYERHDAGVRIVVVAPIRPGEMLGDGLALDHTMLNRTVLANARASAWNAVARKRCEANAPLADIVGDWPLAVLVVDESSPHEWSGA